MATVGCIAAPGCATGRTVRFMSHTLTAGAACLGLSNGQIHVLVRARVIDRAGQDSVPG